MSFDAQRTTGLLAILLGLAMASCGSRDEEYPTVSESTARAVGGLQRVTTDPVTPEQTARRARSIARLRAEGVPVLETLPVVEAESGCHFRSRDEIVDRAIALFVVASRGADDPPDYVAELATRYHAVSRYSPEERAFMGGQPTEQERSALSWRFEALRVLLWALGYLDTLPSPGAPLDGVVMADIIRPRTVEELRAGAHLRSHAEILDWADLIYRYAWATVEARVQGQPPPPGVSPDVVMEWHQALNWLIGYAGADWDDVPTDT